MVGNGKSRTFASLLRDKATGCSTVRLVYLVWDQGVASSNPAIPTEERKLDGFPLFFANKNPLGELRGHGGFHGMAFCYSMEMQR